MAQTSYQLNTPVGVEGQIADSMLRDVFSGAAANDIPFGKGVLRSPVDNFVYRPAPDQSEVVFSANFVTGNTVTFVVNGETVAVDFDTDQATTVTAIVTALDALDNIEAEATDVGGTNRTFEITSLNQPISVIATVTGGASQATATITNTIDSQIFAGVAILTQNIEQTLSGEVEYREGRMVNVMKKGRFYARGETALTVGGNVFMRLTATGSEIAGSFRNDADGSDAIEVPVSVFVGADAGELAVLEVNLP